MLHRLKQGQKVAGRYAVLRPLGEGGMGIVYEVFDEATHTKRALKILNASSVIEEDLVRRFRREASVNGNARSAHLVEITDAGEWEQTPFLVMEKLDGVTLDEWVQREHPVPLSTAKVLLDQLGHGLEAAHAIRVVHRDLKPANVFVADSRLAGLPFVVKILDFGIARRLAGTGSYATRTGMLGTPLWSAPEQSVPGLEVSAATDVWAYGLLAFFVLTGRLYWRNPGSPLHLGRELTNPKYPAASTRARELGVGPLPPDFDAWFAHCVSYAPEGRFSTARAARTALLEVLSPALSLGAPKRVPVQQAPALAVPPTPLALSRSTAAPPSSRSLRLAPLLLGGLGLGGAGVYAVASGHLPVGDLLGSTRESTPPTHTSARTPETRSIDGGAPPLTPPPLETLRARVSPPPPPPAPSAPPPEVPAPSAPVLLAPTPPVLGRRGCPRDMVALSAEGTRSFCIDRFEVTVAAYESCVAAGQCTIPASAPSAGEHWADACNFGRPERAQHPINCVTWAQALQLCHFRGGELPSSEQWILAAGGPGSRYPFPGEPSPLPLNACGSECPEHTGQARDYFGSDPFPMTAPVGSFPGGASVFGVFDLAGNVAEWMSEEVPNAPSMRRIRGGGWLDPPRRVSFVQSQSAEHVGRSVGLRCVTAPSS